MAADDGEEPDYRFTLANERTFLAWVRTALGLLAGGVAVRQLVDPFDIENATTALALLAVGCSVVLVVGGYLRWVAVQRAIRRGETCPPARLVPVVAAALGFDRRRLVRADRRRMNESAGLQAERTVLAWSRTVLAHRRRRRADRPYRRLRVRAWRRDLARRARPGLAALTATRRRRGIITGDSVAMAPTGTFGLLVTAFAALITAGVVVIL